MVNVSREWVAQQKAKASAPVAEGWKQGVLTVFIPGKPYNFKSTSANSHKSLMKHRRLVKEWRERTANRLFMVMSENDMGYKAAPFVHWMPTQPKRVTFTVYSRKPFDDDGLEVTASPSRDALKDMRLIDDDAKACGHRFIYDNEVRPKLADVHGIAIRVELL